MREPTAVIFDLDDTLYAERRFAISAYAAVARYVHAQTGTEVRAVFTFLLDGFRRSGRDGLLQALCVRFALPLAIVPFCVDVIRTHPPALRLPRSSRHVLTSLRAGGHRLGILTNGHPATQRGKIAALCLAPMVDAVVYAHECAPDGKPARACFTSVLDRLRVTPDAAVFVGDHPEKDIAGARAAGLRTIWMVGIGALGEHALPASLEQGSGADALAQDLTEVPALVAQLLEKAHVSL